MTRSTVSVVSDRLREAAEFGMFGCGVRVVDVPVHKGAMVSDPIVHVDSSYVVDGMTVVEVKCRLRHGAWSTAQALGARVMMALEEVDGMRFTSARVTELARDHVGILAMYNND